MVFEKWLYNLSNAVTFSGSIFKLTTLLVNFDSLRKNQPVIMASLLVLLKQSQCRQTIYLAFFDVLYSFFLNRFTLTLLSCFSFQKRFPLVFFPFKNQSKSVSLVVNDWR